MSKGLRTPLHELLDDPVEERDLNRIGAKISAQRERGRGRRGFPVMQWGLAAAAAAGLAIWGVQSWAPSDGGEVAVSRESAEAMPLRFADGSLPETLVVPEAVASMSFQFDEGSEIVASAKTQLVTETNTGEDVDFRLPGGRLDIYVKPGGPRRWRVRTDLGDVIVKGTKFTVVRDEPGLHVDVMEGAVAVVGPFVPGGRQLLGPGESIDVAAPHAATATDQPTATPKADKSWRVMARKKDFDRAYNALGSEGVARESKRAQTAPQLFELADVARLSGHARDAIAPLRRIVDRFPNDPRAGTAAFTLGRIYMTGVNNPKKAAEAFEQAIVLRVPPSLREDAHVRAVEMWTLAKKPAQARAAAERYLSRFPTGQHVTKVRQWVNLPAGE